MHETVFRTAGQVARCEMVEADDGRVDVTIRVGDSAVTLQMYEHQLAAMVQQANRYFDRRLIATALRVAERRTAPVQGAAR